MILTLAVLTCTTLAASADARRPDRDPVLWSVKGHRWLADQARHARCMQPVTRKYRRAIYIPRLERPVALRRELARLRAARSAGFHRCLVRLTPVEIIRYVFPAATEDDAIRVAGCETGWTFNPRAKNPSSSASGLFQLLSIHWQNRDGSLKFDPFDPWANTRYAYRLSRAGTDWDPWVCKP